MKIKLFMGLLSVIMAYDANINLPDEVKDCYATQDISGQNCIQLYLESKMNNYQNTAPNALDWLDSLGRNLHERSERHNVAETIQEKQLGSRGLRKNWWNRRKELYALLAARSMTKTTAGTPPPPKPNEKQNRRIRKEIRTLTDEERADFFEAVNALKNDTSVYPNRYDAFALLHQDTAINSAHRGPNFPSWHRWYLVLFEEALRSIKPKVTLPYWDSRLDFRMDKPEDSVLWSNIFMGNPRGVVVTGPFANWITPQNNTLLRRGIPGPNSSLINPDTIQNVLNKTHNHEILFPTHANDIDNLERHHDAVHNWVGGLEGHMAGLETSPQDPTFWLHHCFIDYLWEEFRQGQIGKGVDPETDYPDTALKPHHPLRPMDNLCPSIRNIEGYNNSFTQDIYEFAPVPTCENKCGGAIPEFLFCNQETNQCQATSKVEFLAMNGFSSFKFTPYLPVSNEEPTISRDKSFLKTVDEVMTDMSPAPKMHHFMTTMVDERTRTN